MDLKRKYLIGLAVFLLILISIPLGAWIYKNKIQPNFKPPTQTYSVVNFDAKKYQVIELPAILTGKGIPNAKVDIFITPKGATGSAKVSKDGKWSFTLPANLASRIYHLTITYEDIRGTMASIKTYRIILRSNISTTSQGFLPVETVFAAGSLGVQSPCDPENDQCSAGLSCQQTSINMGSLQAGDYGCFSNSGFSSNSGPVADDDWAAQMQSFGIYPYMVDGDIMLFDSDTFHSRFCRTGCLERAQPPQTLIDDVKNDISLMDDLAIFLRQRGYSAYYTYIYYYPEDVNFLQKYNIAPVGLPGSSQPALTDDATFINFINQVKLQKVYAADPAQTLINATDPIFGTRSLVKLHAEGFNASSGYPDLETLSSAIGGLTMIYGVSEKISLDGLRLAAKSTINLTEMISDMKVFRREIIENKEPIPLNVVEGRARSAGWIKDLPIIAAGEGQVDAITQRLMDQYGANLDTPVYRITRSQYINNGYLTANPNSIASAIKDFYSSEASLTDSPEIISSSSLDVPSLNVGIGARPPAYYATRSDSVMVEMKLGDFLDQGGRIYPDVYAEGEINPAIITVPNGRVRVVSVTPMMPATGTNIAGYFPNIRFPEFFLEAIPGDINSTLAASADVLTKAFPNKAFALEPEWKVFPEGGFRFSFTDQVNPHIVYDVYSRPFLNYDRAAEENSVLVQLSGRNNVDSEKIATLGFSNNSNDVNPIIIYKTPMIDPQGFLSLTQSQREAEIERVASYIDDRFLRVQGDLNPAIEKDTGKLVVDHNGLTTSSSNGDTDIQQALTDQVNRAVEKARQDFPEGVTILNYPGQAAAGSAITADVTETQANAVSPLANRLKETWQLKPASSAQSGLVREVHAAVDFSLAANEISGGTYKINIPAEITPGDYILEADMHLSNPDGTLDPEIIASNPEPITITGQGETISPSPGPTVSQEQPSPAPTVTATLTPTPTPPQCPYDAGHGGYQHFCPNQGCIPITDSCQGQSNGGLIQGPYPDLVIAPGSLEVNITGGARAITMGKSLSFSATVNNLTNSCVSSHLSGSQFTVGFKVLNSGANQIFFTSAPVTPPICSSQGGGETMPVAESAQWVVPAPGSYTLQVCADVNNNVFESNEANNCLSLPISTTPFQQTMPSSPPSFSNAGQFPITAHAGCDESGQPKVSLQFNPGGFYSVGIWRGNVSGNHDDSARLVYVGSTGGNVSLDDPIKNPATPTQENIDNGDWPYLKLPSGDYWVDSNNPLLENTTYLYSAIADYGGANPPFGTVSVTTPNCHSQNPISTPTFTPSPTPTPRQKQLIKITVNNQEIYPGNSNGIDLNLNQNSSYLIEITYLDETGRTQTFNRSLIFQKPPAPTPLPVEIINPTPTPTSSTVCPRIAVACAAPPEGCSYTNIPTCGGKPTGCGTLSCPNQSSRRQPSVQWSFCVDEYHYCSLTAPAKVRFGGDIDINGVSGSYYVETTVSGSFQCAADTLGVADPDPGVTKHCDYVY